MDDAGGVWVTNDDGTEIVRAGEIVGVSLDYDGNVTARLAGREGVAVMLVGHRTHHDEHRPGDLHRQLIRLIASLSGTAGAFLVRPVHDDPHGWQWVSEPL
jgi:hypothetical protein